MNQPLAWTLDLVLCIDGTASMQSIFERVKAFVPGLPALLQEKMRESGKELGSLRARVIVFRDYRYDDGSGSEQAMEDSGGFVDLLTEEGRAALEGDLERIRFVGGGDMNENALEAIALALKSDWSASGPRRRQIILLFTDADPLPLRDPARVANPRYPADMPADLDALAAVFMDGDSAFAPAYDPNRARLLVFAPISPASAWRHLRNWQNTWLVPTAPDGVTGTPPEELLEALIRGT